MEHRDPRRCANDITKIDAERSWESLRLGLQLTESGRHAEALVAFDEALRLHDPADGAVQKELGAAYRALRDRIEHR